MSYRALLFHPNGDTETYVGVEAPQARDYPVYTWRYMEYPGSSVIVRGWSHNFVYHNGRQWDLMGDEDVPKKLRLLQVIMS